MGRYSKIIGGCPKVCLRRIAYRVCKNELMLHEYIYKKETMSSPMTKS